MTSLWWLNLDRKLTMKYSNLAFVISCLQASLELISTVKDPFLQWVLVFTLNAVEKLLSRLNFLLNTLSLKHSI